MSLIDWLVILVGLGLIGFELWFFLGPRRREPAVASSRTRAQEVSVLVRGGYTPDTIPVEVGRPVRLKFYRDETAECSARLIFETLGIERDLAPFEESVVEFTPDVPGDIPFRCGYSIMKGRVVAHAGGPGARANLGRGHDKHG